MEQQHSCLTIHAKRSVLVALALLVTAFAAAACGAAPPPATAALTAPAANAELALGESSNIIGKVTGADVKAVDVYIDGAKYATVNAASSPDTYDVVAPWTPTVPGSHVVQLKGVTSAGEAVVSSDLIFVMVKAQEPTAAPPTPTVAPQPTQAPTPTAAALAQTDAPSGTVTSTTTTTATTTPRRRFP